MGQSSRDLWTVAWLVMALLVTAAHGRKPHRDDDDDDEEDDVAEQFWERIGGIVVIGALSLFGAGMFSLAAWIVCSCHEKCRKRRQVLNSGGMVHNRPGKGPYSSLPPEWSRSLTIQPELGCGFGVMSEGFCSLSNAQIIRQRTGTDFTDGAKWAAPLTTGKHLFEIIWPWGCRGYHATVGVATRDAPLKVKGGASLVGGNAHSWGLDIVRRRTVHNNRTLVTCPTDGSYVPDRFLMYVDVDEGTIGFGNDITFWGNVITGLPRGKPLFPMVGSGKWDANIQVFYRGSAGTSGFNPYSAAGPSYSLPPVAGPLPPTYADIFKASGVEQPQGPTTSHSDARPISPRSAWEIAPPPTPGPSAPAGPIEPPPPYTSPVPKY